MVREKVIFLLLATVGSAALCSSSSRVEKGFSLHIDEAVVSVEGICSLEGDSVSCWSTDGTILPDLAKRVEAHFINGSGESTSLKFRSKNRAIVLRTTSSNPASRNGINLYLHYNNSNDYGNTSYSSQDAIHQIFWISTTEETKKAAFQLSYTRHIAAKSIPLKIGSFFGIGSHTLKIDSIEAVPPNEMTDPLPPKWKIGYSISPADKTTEKWNFSFSPVKADGQPINFVDKKGIPVINNGNGYMGQRLFDTYSKQGVIISGIDPSQITSIQISVQSNESYAFPEVPLDPKVKR